MGDEHDTRDDFDTDDLPVADVAGRSSEVRLSAEPSDLALARLLKWTLIPSRWPSVRNYAFAGFHRRQGLTSSEFYDWYQTSTGEIQIVMAICMGSTHIGSLLASRLSGAAAATLPHTVCPAEAMSRLNQVFCSTPGTDGHFATAVVVSLLPDRNAATIVNAGHPGPLLIQRQGVVDSIGERSTGLPLGIDKDATFESFDKTLSPGDTLLLYGDGIQSLASSNGKPISVAGLIELLRGGRKDATGTIQALHAAIDRVTDDAESLADLSAVAISRDAD